MNRGIILLSFVATSWLFGVEELEKIVVTDVTQNLEQSGKLKDVIVKTEVVSKKAIEDKMASKFSEAVDGAVGVQSATGCSLCGLKRVKINGLKEEHTTVLFDDVPMHSTVSSYYGMDAISMAGIETIEIARGGGSALIAPESIGGVINIKSQKIKANALEATIESVDGKMATSILGSLVTPDGKTKASLNVSNSKTSQVDGDNNGVSESPSIDNKSVRLKVSNDIGEHDNLNFVYNRLDSKVKGGGVDGYTYGVTGNSDPLFVDNDVRKKYIGEAVGITETIETSRDEIVGKWRRKLNDDGDNMAFTLSYAKQKQNSIYESDTYDNVDDSYFGDIRFNKMLNDENLLTFGLDYKDEKMRSESSFFANPAVNKDDFDSSRVGVYIQDTYMPSEDTEIALALRADKLSVDWRDTGSGDEIDKTVLTPRIHVKHSHDKEFTSRLSLGSGYRVPLTFFESEHGLLDGGFGVDISDIEKSKSANYTLSYDDERLTSTLSFGVIELKNLAYIDDSGAIPILKTSDETMFNKNLDITAGYQLTPEITFGGSYEHYFYDKAYKLASDVASIEDRAKLSFDYDKEGWGFNTTATWIGSRDLSEYGYKGWSDADDVGDDSKQKASKVSSYYTVDTKLTKEINKNFSLYAGVKNIFDYTQVEKGESPLFYDVDGGFDTAYIYAPLRGREYVFGVKATF